jgi:hypothetical protein
MAKKRYVGFKYESPDEKEPTFDAKGIETVRRDGVLAQRKLVENCLKLVTAHLTTSVNLADTTKNTVPYAGFEPGQGLLLSFLVQNTRE